MPEEEVVDNSPEAAPNTGPVGQADTQDLGQGESQAPAEVGQAEPEQAEPFFRYKHDDGEEMIFNNQDELSKTFREGLLRHRDYTKKTQELAEQRKAFESEQQQKQAEWAQFLEMKQKYDKYDQFLRQNPQIAQELQRRMSGAQGQGRVPPELQQQIEELKQWKEEREKRDQEMQNREQRRAAQEKAHELLSGRYPDYDRKAVEEMIAQLEQTPPGDEELAYLELLHLAAKGRRTPAELEEQMAERLQKKKNSHSPMPSGQSAPQGGKRTFKNLDEAAKAALAENK